MICTFYSYKGGVGRTMALANVAEIFYKAGYRVLVVDWDLEAPGLERFFPSVGLPHVLDMPGLMDMLVRYRELMANELGEDMPLELENPARYAIDVYPFQSDPGKLLDLNTKRCANKLKPMLKPVNLENN